jgi:tight adherence protein C
MPSFALNFDYGPVAIAFLIAFSVLSLGGLAWAVAQGRDPVRRRLDELSDGHTFIPTGEITETLKQVLVNFLRRLAKPALPRRKWQMTQLKNNMLFAGFRSQHAVSIYLGIRMGLCFLVPPFLLLTPLYQRVQGPMFILILVATACVGFMLPSFLLDRVIRKRRAKIVRELPDVLDLLVIAVEAGLGLDAAIRRVAHEVKISSPLLSNELNLVSLELKAGIPRQMALKNLAARCGVDDISSLVTMLVQADRFGVSVGRSLRVHSDTVRTKRRQKLEEAAAKVPLKLLFPVLFLIFPAIMFVMAGPAIIKVSESIIK